MAPAVIAERPTGAPPSQPRSVPPPPSLRAFIKQHPVLTYFVLVFALSWGAILPFTRGPIPTSTADPMFMFVILAAPVAPTVAGLLMTGLVDGKAGYRALLARLLRWQVGLRWYAMALLFAPLLTATILLGLSQFSTEFRPKILTTQDVPGLLLLGVATAVPVAFCEELGWTGFAIPQLRRRYGILATGLLVGFVWGLWHLPLFWQRESFSAAFPLALLLVQLFSWLPAYRVLMVWLYDRTGSLLLAMLMHASLIAGFSIILATSATGLALLTSILVWAAALWVLVAAVATVNRRHLARQPLWTRVA